MTYSDPFTSSPFDQALADTPGLTWVPWVGENYAKLGEGRRLLIVGESHYAGWDHPERADESITDLESYRGFTREVVHESLVLARWSTRTLSAMHNLFHAPEDRNALWSDLCFYNFVQKAMNYSGTNRERPHWKSFYNAWGVFLEVIDILQPSHVLFIGVSAADHFRNFMVSHTIAHTPVKKVEKVGSTYARTAEIRRGQRTYPIHFIKHCGKCFPTDAWRDYLHRETGGLMASLALSAGSTSSSEN